MKDFVLNLFHSVVNGDSSGHRIPIGKLTQEGKAYIESTFGVQLKTNVDFVLNASDLKHIYKEHYGKNEKDKGNNVPLTDEDIRDLVDVISHPDHIVYAEEKRGRRKIFYFFRENPNGTYNLAEVYGDRRGNLTAKSYFNTKRTISQRVNDLKKSQTLTSVTEGASSSSSAKVPKLFETSKENAKYQKTNVSQAVFVSNARRAVLDMANGEATLSRAQKRALETAPLIPKEGSPADISNADSAKVQQKLETLAKNLEKVSSHRKNFLDEVADALGAKKHGSNSRYVTIEAKNGKIVAIRLSNHNATVSTFDKHDEDEGISIVVSPRSNQGMNDDGNAHIVEFFYPEIAIRKAEGKPLAEIVRSIEQSLYSGEYKDTTGLAEVQEVNANPQCPSYQKANVSQAVFMSNARRAVEGIRQEKATPEQWLAMLQKQGGLKAGEDKWLGLSDWLKGQDKKSLTKQEVLDFIDQNQIQIEEVNYSENVDILSATERDIQENIARGHSLEELQEQIDTEIRLAGDELDGMDTLSRAQKRALETVSVSSSEEHLQTVVSSTDGAKVINNLDTLAKEIEKKEQTPVKTFLGEVAKAINAKKHGSGSQYATFETKSGKIITIRLADHNATVSTFDHHNESDGVSIVVSPKKNNGVVDDGNAHVTEFYYNSIKLRRAEGKPLAEIVRSIEQSLYSGEYKDTTGLAEVQEVNAGTTQSPAFHRVYHGSAADFDRFDHNHMGEGEGVQAFGWGTYVTEVKGIGKTYAEQASRKQEPTYKGLSPAAITGLSDDVNNSLGITNKAQLEALAHITASLKYGYGDPVRMIRAHAEYIEDRIKRKEREARRLSEEARYESGEKKERLERRVQRRQESLAEDRELLGFVRSLNPYDFEGWTKKYNPTLYTVEIPEDAEGNTEVVEADNRRYNGQIRSYAAGLMKSHETISLGAPSAILKRCGIEADELRIKQSVLSEHLKKHGLSWEDIMNLPKALQKPVMIYVWGSNVKAHVIITELTTEDGRKVSLAVRIRENEGKNEVTDISSVFGKESARMLREMTNGKSDFGKDNLRYVDKEKALEWLSMAPPEGASATTQELNSVAKIIQEYENPKVSDEKVGKYLDYTAKMRDQQDILAMVDDYMSKNEVAGFRWKRQTVDERIQYRAGNRLITLTPNQSGADLYEEFSVNFGPQPASEILHRAGLTGIKYPAEYTSGGRADGAKNYVIFDENDLQITEKIKFFRTPDGQAYGFTLNGKIYLDPRIATAETPIHEYGHLWVEALAEANPEAWEHLKGELEQDTDLVNYVKGRYPDLEGDELWEEVFTHFSGRRGRERMEEERRRMMNEEPDLMGKARVARMFYRLRRALKRFWTMARDLFAGNNARLKTMKAEDFADAMMADLVHGFNPRTGELAEQRIRRMADKYNSKQLVFLNDKMNGLEVFDALDIPEEIFEGDMPTQEEKIAFVEEIKQFTEKSYAFYFPPSDKIIIFAERIPSHREEETFFHENIHAILRSWYGASPAPRRIAEAFWDLAPAEGGEVSKSYIEKKYRDTPEKWKEEFFVTWLGRAMAHGSVDEVTNLLQDSGDKSRIESIEHSLGYDRGEETAARGEGTRRTEEDTSRGSQEDGKILQGQRNNRLTSSSDGVPRYQLAGEGGNSDNGTDSSNSSENEANEGTFVGEDGIHYEAAPSRRGKPRKRQGETQLEYVQRLRDWERLQQFLEDHPRPLEPEISQEELTREYNDYRRNWMTRHGLP